MGRLFAFGKSLLCFLGGIFGSIGASYALQVPYLSKVPVAILVVALAVGKYFARGGQYSGENISRASKAVAIVTGANSGIGFETAKYLAKVGCRVVMACRSPERAKAAIDLIKRSTPDARLDFIRLDLQSLDSIDDFVQQFRSMSLPLNYLFNNAGIMACPFSLTKDGFESQFGTNHVGHFHLTTSLLNLIQENKARVINVSSEAHTMPPKDTTVEDIIAVDEKKYNNWINYGYSKLANIYFTTELQKRLASSGASTYCLHPGVVNTELLRHVPWVFILIWRTIAFFISKTSLEGAQTSLFCAFSDSAVAGGYHLDAGFCKPTRLAQSEKAAADLWEQTERLIKSHH